jgi:hypothetical protein
MEVGPSHLFAGQTPDRPVTRPASFEAALITRIAELTKALQAAQEAIFWHLAEGFENEDGQRVGDVMKSALRQVDDE